jgi:hypothetical protein
MWGEARVVETEEMGINQKFVALGQAYETLRRAVSWLFLQLWILN